MNIFLSFLVNPSRLSSQLDFELVPELFGSAKLLLSFARAVPGGQRCPEFRITVPMVTHLVRLFPQKNASQRPWRDGQNKVS